MDKFTFTNIKKIKINILVYGSSITTELRNREKEFTQYDQFSIFFCTWNLGANSPAGFNFRDLFNFEGNKIPDMVVIGFQEMVDLNAKNVVVSANLDRISEWRELLQNNLKNIDKSYNLIQSMNLVGIQMYVFLLEKFIKRATNMETDIVKCGFGNKLGNKGAVIFKLNIDDTSIGIINAHLEAGSKKNLERLNNVKDIHQKAFQQEGVGRKRQEKLETLNYKFLMGDLNFRINLPNNEVRNKIELIKEKTAASANLIQDLMEYDQLTISKFSHEYLKNYDEAPIRFLPTYKYDKLSNEYDSSKKQRVPSWYIFKKN